LRDTRLFFLFSHPLSPRAGDAARRFTPLLPEARQTRYGASLLSLQPCHTRDVCAFDAAASMSFVDGAMLRAGASVESAQ
jgi:hypothetical protein